MTNQRLPCQEGDADSWFIEKDGKQYRDDDLLTEAEVRGLTKSVLAIEGETAEEHRDRVDKTIAAAGAARKRANLQRRRHAKEACHTCPLRLECLAIGLQPENLAHGTWGGYYAEERQEIDRLRRERQRRRGGVN